MSEATWQWVDNHFGPMGWFTDADKTKYEGTEEFSNGKWVPVTPEELAEFNQWLGRMLYEQS